jgi:flagellar M-ring protein FliF
VNEQADRQFGVNHETTTTTKAPGTVELLSVAVVMDDGSKTGATVPDSGEVEELVSAALGLDTARGDTIKVTQLPFPKPEEAAAGPGMTAMVPQAVGGLVLLVVAVALFMMSRGRGKKKGAEGSASDEWSDGGILPAAAVVASLPAPVQTDSRDVMDLVQRQPEEIAGLLRAWLADRRR